MTTDYSDVTPPYTLRNLTRHTGVETCGDMCAIQNPMRKRKRSLAVN